MPNIPWDLLTSKLGRYLQLSYISAVLAGACIIGEFIVRALSGSPARRRQSAATAISKVVHSHVNVLIVILLVILAILAAYVVGVSVRFITIAVTNFASNWFYRLRSLTDYWSWLIRGREEFLKKYAAPKIPEPYGDRGRFIRLGRGPVGHMYDVKRPLGALAYLWDISHHKYPEGKEIWQLISATYGEERVISALAAHPIRTPIEGSSDIAGVYDYCRLWLNKYAPDMAVTVSATGRLIAFTFFIPVLLLPGSLWLVSYGVYARGGWHFIWIVVILFFLYQIIVRARGGNVVYQLFYRFVTVQLIEQSRIGSKSTQANTPSAPVDTPP